MSPVIRAGPRSEDSWLLVAINFVKIRSVQVSSLFLRVLAPMSAAGQPVSCAKFSTSQILWHLAVAVKLQEKF